MKRTRIIAVVLVALLLPITNLSASDQAKAPAVQDYIIGPGDVLEISVWGNADLSKLVPVLPDGKIHFPLINEVVAGGKTVADLEKELKKRIDVFVPTPDLTVMVQQVNSMLVYVIGKVNRPGRFTLTANIDVLQALTMAGGLNAFAKRNKIKIFRKEKNKTNIIKFSYDDVTEGKSLEQNIQLKRGDVIVVP
jgi:polysaccharide export outer membrane protein